MKSTPRKAARPEFLSGWKEISHYLGMGVRTVQRYERHAGLPVRRPAGKPAGSVVATKAELDAWVSASPIREAFQLKTETSRPSRLTLDTIHRSVAVMSSLREQMLELRGELHTSVELLHQSLRSLQSTLTRNSAQGLRSLALITESERENLSRTFEINNTNAKRRAS